jgi:alpha/beta superfamily hydrolase
VNRIFTADGLLLEARWDLPADDAAGVAVLCHPHPLQGGTMTAPLMGAVCRSLVDRRFAVLRFNFRGVGRSEGTWGGGEAEVGDVAAAVATARDVMPGLPLGVSGWSFGAVASLRWQAADGSRIPWAGIAPPLRLSSGGPLPDPASLEPAPRLIVLGDRDQFTGVDGARAYAGSIGSDFEVLRGSDHFFAFREDTVGGLVAAHLAGRSTVIEAE